MSKYLEIKLLKALRNTNSSTDEMVSEGIGALKDNISDVKVDGGYKKVREDVQHVPHYQGTELADVAIDVYRSNIRPVEEATEEERPCDTTPAIRKNIKALANTLVGIRNGGDAGRLRMDAGENGGDMRVGDGRVIHTEEKTIADMSVEEYQEYLSGKNTIVEEVEEEEQTEPELLVEDPVKDLEEKLMEMKEHSWQSIDKVMRGIAKEYDITPKQLHKDFKSAHDGQIPDEWIKENQVAEECGWFPMSEASIVRRGSAYDVTLIWKGQTRRLKFFWPDLAYPKESQMQKAAQLFYPGARLITYYPTREDNDNFMVLVPPMKENYTFVGMDAWVTLDDKVQDILYEVEEYEGEIISGLDIDDDVVSFLISDNETGEEREVMLEISSNKAGAAANERFRRARKEKDPDKKAKMLDKYDKSKAYQDKKHKGYMDKLTEDDMKGMSQKSGDKRSTESGAGLTAKGVAKYRAKNPGSKLKTAVTTPPSKLKAGSKAAGRRKSFCARSRGWNGERGKAARRRWNC